MIGNTSGLNFPGPFNNHGNTDPTFVKVSLLPPEWTVRIKEFCVVPALIVVPVVAGKHDDCVVANPKFRQ